MAKKNDDITFIDLFCGVGGIRLGMNSANFRCVFSSEINNECIKTYKTNFNEIPFGDITIIDAKEVPHHDILCAGFPCQPFSISGKQKGFNDIRGTLFFDICRIVEYHQPKVILLENVKNLIYHDEGYTFKIIMSSLVGLGYNVSWKILNAIDFGLPQNRERIIIVASKYNKFDFDKLPNIDRTSLNDILDKDDTFTYLDENEYTIIDNPKYQSKSGLIFVGYRNKNMRTKGVLPNTEHLSRAHKQPNRIYSSKGANPTLQSQETSGRYFILTDENKVRKLSINECWKIMGFPNEFVKVSPISEQYRQLGNSVCVPMISEIAKEIRNQFF